MYTYFICYARCIMITSFLVWAGTLHMYVQPAQPSPAHWGWVWGGIKIQSDSLFIVCCDVPVRHAWLNSNFNSNHKVSKTFCVCDANFHKSLIICLLAGVRVWAYMCMCFFLCWIDINNNIFDLPFLNNTNNNKYSNKLIPNFGFKYLFWLGMIVRRGWDRKSIC